MPVHPVGQKGVRIFHMPGRKQKQCEPATFLMKPSHPKGKLGCGMVLKLPLPTAEKAAGQTHASPSAAETRGQRMNSQSTLNLVKKAFHSASISGFMFILPRVMVNATLKSKTSESELLKK